MAKYFVGIIVLIAVASAAAVEKTVITGDQMEIVKGGEKVVFTGNSKVTRGESILKARKIVQDKKRDRVEATGDISFYTVTQDREPMSGSAQKAFYNTKTGDGELWEGRPSITYQVKDATGPVHLNADRIFVSQGKQEIRAVGSVELISSSATALSQRAVFFQKEKKAVLSGFPEQPEIRYNDVEQQGRYSADLITIFVDSKNVVMDGNVRGKVNFVSKSSATAVRHSN